MTDYASIERLLTEALALERRPVAVTFRESAPASVAKFSGTEPSGCSFWRLVAGGRTFSTVAADHHNCPIGSYTHAITLPPERAPELEQTLSLMAGIGYIDVAEDELYVVVPGKDLARIAEQLRTITEANATLLDYHRGRRQSLASE